MGRESITDTSVNLVIFTCQGREHLLLRTIKSFYNNCDFKFDKTILAIDGPVDPEVITQINPDVVVQQYQRHGYVSSITRCLKNIDSPYFFWLEDDWTFNKPMNITPLLDLLKKNNDWAEIVYSKFGPLNDGFKAYPLGSDLYKTTFGFSANPSLCSTTHLRAAFNLLSDAEKGNRLGEDGFENFLSRTFEEQHIKCVIIDPVDHLPISHEGFLESTPREWHMINSLQSKTLPHLLHIPEPSLFRRFLMIFKLLSAFFSLAMKQLFSNKAYELCFRIMSLARRLGKNE